jgi:hypothetical protein
VAAREPGELVCLDTFYIGQLKGVGKVWQSRPAMRPAPTGWPGCCPPTPPRPRPTSCAESCSRSIAAPAGGCAASSPTAAPSSRGPSMRPVGRWTSATRGRSRDMPGPMASSCLAAARSPGSARLCRSVAAAGVEYTGAGSRRLRPPAQRRRRTLVRGHTAVAGWGTGTPAGARPGRRGSNADAVAGRAAGRESACSRPGRCTGISSMAAGGTRRARCRG